MLVKGFSLSFTSYCHVYNLGIRVQGIQMSHGSSLGHLILREYKPIGRYLKHLLDELDITGILSRWSILQLDTCCLVTI